MISISDRGFRQKIFGAAINGINYYLPLLVGLFFSIRLLQFIQDGFVLAAKRHKNAQRETHPFLRVCHAYSLRS